MSLLRRIESARPGAVLTPEVPGAPGSVQNQPAPNSLSSQRLLTASPVRESLREVKFRIQSRVISDLKRRGLIAIEKQDRIRITDICGICHLTGTH